jgi:hypothetical protein
VSPIYVIIGNITYNPTNGYFTVPLSGKYFIGANFSFTNSHTTIFTKRRRDVVLYKISASTGKYTTLTSASVTATAIGDTRISIGWIDYLNAGDSVFFGIYQNSDDLLYIFPTTDPLNRFVICRLA